MPVQTAITQLRALSSRMFKQYGFAGPAADVAVAAFNLLYRNPRCLQYQNIAICQFDANKLSVVEQRGYSHNGSAQLIWVARPKAEVLDEVMDNIADVLDSIINTMPHKVPKKNIAGLQSIVTHVLRPPTKCICPGFEQMWRDQHPDKALHLRYLVCEKVCLSMQAHV